MTSDNDKTKTLYVSRDTHQKIKIISVKNDISMSDLVDKILNEYVEKEQNK